MKYEIKSDLVWNRANALSSLYSFVSHMSCAGHRHIGMTVCNHYVDVTLFMEEEDNVDDIKEVASHYLTGLFESAEQCIRDEERVTRWITYTYRWEDL